MDRQTTTMPLARPLLKTGELKTVIQFRYTQNSVFFPL